MASDVLCPPNHSHSQNCYSKHGCRCQQCRSANASQRMRTYWSRVAREGGDVPIPATGAQRRLQALAYIGWSSNDIEKMSGISQSYLREVRRGERSRVSRSVHEKIDQVYRKHCVTPNYSTGSHFTKANARRLEYKSALYWEDIDRDGDLGYMQYA